MVVIGPAMGQRLLPASSTDALHELDAAGRGTDEVEGAAVQEADIEVGGCQAGFRGQITELAVLRRGVPVPAARGKTGTRTEVDRGLPGEQGGTDGVRKVGAGIDNPADGGGGAWRRGEKTGAQGGESTGTADDVEVGRRGGRGGRVDLVLATRESQWKDMCFMSQSGRYVVRNGFEVAKVRDGSLPIMNMPSETKSMGGASSSGLCLGVMTVIRGLVQLELPERDGSPGGARASKSPRPGYC